MVLIGYFILLRIQFILLLYSPRDFHAQYMLIIDSCKFPARVLVLTESFGWWTASYHADSDNDVFKHDSI